MIKQIRKKSVGTIQTKAQFVVCLRNDGYELDLQPRKVYRVLPDAAAAKFNQVRIVDETGEDYLYPAEFFARVSLSKDVIVRFAASA